jgi:D-sedoheptulose 7-phosphate isomerase
LRQRRQRFDGFPLRGDIVKGASYQEKKRFHILALADSMPTLTAYSNDVRFESVFAELKNFAQPR